MGKQSKRKDKKAASSSADGGDGGGRSEEEKRILREQFARGAEAYAAGDYRTAFDRLLAAFRSSGPTGGVWHEERYPVMRLLLEAVRNLVMGSEDVARHVARSGSGITEADVKALIGIVDSKAEPLFFRVLTVDAVIADRLKRNGDMEEASDLARRGICLLERMCPEERQRRVFVGAFPFQSQPTRRTVQELLAPVEQRMRGLLSNVPTPSQPARDDDPPEVAKFRKRLRFAGGGECTRCEKTLQELGVKQLPCCSRCKVAYYCSQECQAKAWREGHKTGCRKPGQIEEGDILQIRGLDEMPAVTEKYCGAVRQDPDRPDDNWEVQLYEGPEAIGLHLLDSTGEFVVDFKGLIVSVPQGHLFHIRPSV